MDDFSPPFAFKIIPRYRDGLSQQIGEAIKILYTPDTILNSKSEYLSNNIPRLTILEEDWDVTLRQEMELPCAYTIEQTKAYIKGHQSINR